jgi:hypothetical protein
MAKIDPPDKETMETTIVEFLYELLEIWMADDWNIRSSERIRVYLGKRAQDLIKRLEEKGHCVQ